jgi:hypothetical protein
MPSLLSLEGRIARVEARLRPASPRIADRSRWDWYAGSCPCGRPAGDCTIHPRARAAQRPPGRVGLVQPIPGSPDSDRTRRYDRYHPHDRTRRAAKIDGEAP